MMRCHDAVRIIFDIDDRDAEDLRRLAYRERTSRAAQLRIAVRAHLRNVERPSLTRSFARWPEAPDGADLQARIRDEELA